MQKIWHKLKKFNLDNFALEQKKIIKLSRKFHKTCQSQYQKSEFKITCATL